MGTESNLKLARKSIKKDPKGYKWDRIDIIRSLVDNFILLFLEPSNYYRTFKEYINLQFRHRTKYFLRAIILFFMSLYFIFFFIGFLFVGLYFLLYEHTANHILSIFLVAWISFLFFFIILYISFLSFHKVGGKLPEIRRNNK